MLRVAKHGVSALAYAAHKAARSAALRRMLFNSIRLNRIESERFRSMEECGFLAYSFLNRHESKSQILQDLWVGYELGERRGGFFVEFGATDGLVNSNTWLLENKYGWTGILAEPNPVWHSALRVNRNSIIDHRCVSSSTGKIASFLTTDGSDPELSAIAEFADGDHFAGVRAEGVAIKVETVSLNQLLTEHDAPAGIDYLSIDTEGSEYDILSHFDFSRHRIDLISVEQNRHTEPRIEALLTGQGYDRVFSEFSQWDGWYVRAEWRRQGARFRTDTASPGS
ncbi:FkbM family methyltransferase [Bradyrhizobium sp. dw_78]|uniref:FkbM family methyltransferase n=1 Tax=Bradyrhizobium sp. dw_78 TaxID=2719793 RepID=UPI001BD27799|nr:FkbM family methyltransferase [Bradyrhizobium sp. dw_78]